MTDRTKVVVLSAVIGDSNAKLETLYSTIKSDMKLGLVDNNVGMNYLVELNHIAENLKRTAIQYGSAYDYMEGNDNE